MSYAIAPSIAQVAAGTAIRNTATGTFTDGTTIYNATSNEVTIQVAEVAGIKIDAQPLANANPNAGDLVYAEFVITNTGNDPTQFFIPELATLSNTTAFQQEGPIQIIAVNGATVGPVNVPTGGASTGTILSNPTLAPNPGTGTTGTVRVRVPIRVLASASATSTLTVSLGDTTTPNSNNVDRAGANSGKEVYSVDNANGVGGETNTTTPTVKEAMATSATITVAARLQSFAAIFKAVGGYNNNTTPNVLTDDTLTYNLALKVDNPTSPPAGLAPSDLYGTQLNVDSSTANAYVLVSDVIPANMQLGATANITAPSGWTIVYTTDPLTTNALNANWVSLRPSVGTITRVGFVFRTSTTPTPTPIAKGPVGIGTTVTGFSFAVTPQAGFTGGQVANIAQVFGQSQPGAIVAGTATQLVYDESGDQSTNNGLNGNNPDPTTSGASPTAGGITNGKADPTTDGIDPSTGSDPMSGTNQGSDVLPPTNPNGGTNTLGGEDTVYTIAATPLNGPNNQPAAVGPTDNNDDFTHKSIVVPPNTPPNTSVDAPVMTFDNTVQNTTATPQVISLLPTPPATATALPDNTFVTISAGGQTATYNYTATGGFAFVSGTGGTSATMPVQVTVAPNSTTNYQVTVDLPSAPQLQGYPVPITAFIDSDNNGVPNNEPSNTTIDRVYTGYLSLVKSARILESNGTPVTGPAGTFTTVQSDLSAAATPGRMIEYQITYQNISIGGGTNNAILPANNLVITENGSTGGNNWFATTLDPVFAVSSGIGSATDSNSGTITVTTSGSPADIQQYQDTVTTVAPGGSGTFTFRRTIR
jgi:hypothetical protein